MGDGEQQLVAAFHDLFGLATGFLSSLSGAVSFVYITDNQNDEDDDEDKCGCTDEDGYADVFLDGGFASLDFGDGGIENLLVEVDEQVGDLFRELVVGFDQFLGLALVFLDFVPILSLGLIGE